MKILLENQAVRFREFIHRHNNAIEGIAIVPDKYKIAVFSYDVGLYFSNFQIDIAYSFSRTGAISLKADDRAIFSMVWKPDGTEILTGGAAGEATRWDAQNGEVITKYQFGENPILSVAWSPDGRQVAGGGWDNCIYIADTLSHETKLVADLGTPPAMGEGDALAWIGWSPDGKHLATAGWDKKVRIWEVTNDAINIKFELEGHTESLYCGAWIDDGAKLASGGESIHIWDTSSGKLSQKLGNTKGSINTIAWKPENSFIAAGDSKGAITIWNTETGQQIRQIQTMLDDIRTVAWFSNYLLYGGKSSDRWMIPIFD